MAAILRTNSLASSDGSTIDINGFADTNARYYRQTLRLIDSTSRTGSTTWSLGATWGPYTGFAGGSILKIHYMIPARNDDAGWGGMYFEPQIQFNGGSWQSLGSRGYDAVMTAGVQDIHGTSNCMIIDPGLSSTFSVSLQYYFKSYSGTIWINLNHDLNNISGTANGGLLSGDNGLQHYAHFIIEELALFKGV